MTANSAKILKIASKCSEDEFLLEAGLIMAEQKEFVANPHEKLVQLMMVELNWLFKTRKLLGLPNAELTEHYLREIDNYAEGYEQYR